MTHVFSHFRLRIEPRVVETRATPARIMDDGGTRWHDPAQPAPFGLPAPVARLMSALTIR